MVKRQFKYFSTSERNTPEYKLWRLSVYQRDKFRCRKCDQKMHKGKNLNAHHIRSWANYPSLRYDVNNGITLCYKCHKTMFQNEDSYINLCMILLSNKEVFVKAQRLLHEERMKDEQQNIQ